MSYMTIFKSGSVFLTILALVLVAQAAFVTIDTDNGVIDPAWANVPVSSQKPKTIGVLDGYNIKSVWVSRDAINSFWYFRADLYGPLPTDNFSSIEARIDCSDDNSFTSSLDKIVFYYHSASNNTLDNVIECAGIDNPLCSTDGESKGWDFGEEIPVGDGSFAYEWKADTKEPGGIDWSACGKRTAIQFVMIDAQGNVVDSTTPMQFGSSPFIFLPIVKR